MFLKRLLLATILLAAATTYSRPPSPEAIEKWRSEGILEQKLAQWRNFVHRNGLDVIEPIDLRDLQKRQAETAADDGVDTMYVPVIMIDFPDWHFYTHSPTGTPHAFDSILFSEGYYNPTGSMTDYYLENTYGKLYIKGQVYGPYTMSMPYSSYVGDDNGMAEGSALAAEAVTAADPDIDYTLYDSYPKAGDGIVDGIILIHPGPGGEHGDPNAIWSHKSIIAGHDLYDEMVLSSYTINPEEDGFGHLSAIGVFCHEHGHVLGLPDLYDTSYRSRGLGRWSMMAGGSYNGNSQTPSQFDAWCKIYLSYNQTHPLNFLDYVLLDTFNLKNAMIPNIETTPLVYILPEQPEEYLQYFVIENRQPYGYDTDIPGWGMFIYHIDNNISTNSNPPRYRVALEQADGLKQLENNLSNGDPGDPFPGSTNNRNFFDYSTPSSQLNYLETDSTPSGISVWNISSSADTMYADLEVYYTRPYLFFSNDENALWIRDDVADAGNNGDGLLQAGETIKISCEVYNVMMKCSHAYVKLLSSEPSIEILHDSIKMSSVLTPNLLVNNHSDPIIIHLPEDMPTGNVDFGLEFIIDSSRSGPYGVYRDTLEFTREIFSKITAVGDDGDLLPESFTLNQNYPNPFNPTTTISYTIHNAREADGRPARTRLTIYNTLGQEVKTLVDEPQKAGSYEVTWDATDNANHEVASGIYLYKLERGKAVQSHKMILLR